MFADWLRERADERAEGVRAIVAIGRRSLPCRMASESSGKPGPVYSVFGNDKVDVEQFKVRYALCMIPPDWFDLLAGSVYESSQTYRKHYRSRREAGGAATAAFARLPAPRRAGLQTTPGGRREHQDSP